VIEFRLKADISFMADGIDDESSGRWRR